MHPTAVSHSGTSTSNPNTWSKDVFRARVGELLQQDDFFALEALYWTLSSEDDENSHHGYNTKIDCIHLVLEHDRIDMLLRLTNEWGYQLGMWGSNHFESMVENCPNTYEQWEDSDYGSSLRELNKVLLGRTDDVKEAILKGQGQSRCEQRFHELLALDPTAWNYVSVLWAGKKDSILRQTALQLGFRTSMLPEMLAQDDMPNTAHCSVLRYPYSLYQLAQIEQEIVNRKNAGPGYDDYQKTRVWQKVCAPNANADDVALANALMVQMQTIVGGAPTVFHRFELIDGTAPSSARLEQLVQTYASLNCLDALAQFLADDVLPGVEPTMMLDIPGLDTFSLK